jgi:hypothetical protein
MGVEIGGKLRFGSVNLRPRSVATGGFSPSRALRFIRGAADRGPVRVFT